MNCAELESILADFIDESLLEGERSAVEQHLAGCPACREFAAEVRAGLSLLERAGDVIPPQELITRIAYQAPLGKVREPFEEEEGLFSRWLARWLRPLLQPRLAMGMAMTVLSFAMLERCTGIQTQHLQAADLNPVRVWGGLEDKAIRVKDRVVKYYENLRIVYEVETRLRDLQEPDASAAPAEAGRQSRPPAVTNSRVGGSAKKPDSSARTGSEK